VDSWTAQVKTVWFEDYFWQSTVITEIASLNLGSRPASRAKGRSIEDLRAIPWVFSWAQCRVMLAGWYGFGAAVDAVIAKHGGGGLRLLLLQTMFQEWPVFSTLLLNMDMVLSKADMRIAERYAGLVEDEGLRARIFPRIRRSMSAHAPTFYPSPASRRCSSGIQSCAVR
jgi:phosphoenolpyruvate carboxylase